MKEYRIARIPGDGIGVDVTNAAWEVLLEAARRHAFKLLDDTFPWSCEFYLRHGHMMPADGLEVLSRYDAIFLGAVGWPEKVPDNVSLHGLLLPIRNGFDLYVNERPHKPFPGTRIPIKTPEFDILCIRENTEGEYGAAGGRIHVGTPHEIAVETSIFSRRAVERVLRYGFERARSRSGRLASVTKSNALKHTMVFWDEVTERVAADYPDIKVTRYHVDAISARFVTHPDSLDVVVASNLFGDILTDIGAAIQGGLGFAASANVNPAGGVPSMFEPVHGSAPDIAGKGSANPIASIWAGSMMLRHLGAIEAAEAIMSAIGTVVASGIVRTPDQGGTSSTIEVARAVSSAMRGR